MDLAQVIIWSAIPRNTQSCKHLRVLCPHASRTHRSLNPEEPAVLPRLVKETANFPENHWSEALKEKCSN